MRRLNWSAKEYIKFVLINNDKDSILTSCIIQDGEKLPALFAILGINTYLLKLMEENFESYFFVNDVFKCRTRY